MEQDSFTGSEIPLLRLIPLTNRIAEIDKIAKDYALTKSQVIIMTILYSQGILNMSKIAEYISSSKEQATRAVASLVDKGLVKRIEFEKNRKNVFIEYTESGKELMEKFHSSVRSSIEKKLRKSLTDEEFESLVTSVRTVITLLGKVE